jgi:hypothetical protein
MQFPHQVAIWTADRAYDWVIAWLTRVAPPATKQGPNDQHQPGRDPCLDLVRLKVISCSGPITCISMKHGTQAPGRSSEEG